ncbi:MAG: hypothetical protein QW409_03445, partial [Candidatus Aenigmatarchaeota archaeon]
MDLITHFLSSLPLTFFLMNKSEVKKIFYFLIFIFLFSCLPDVDYLIGIEHRALTHSITFSVFFS